VAAASPIAVLIQLANRSRRIAGAIVLVGAVLSLAACSGSNQPSATLPIPSGALVFRVVNTTFQPSQLTMPAGQAFTLYFDNAESQPHNVVILGPGDQRLLAGDIFTGPAQKVYDVPALASGTYQLHCDVHPEMYGTITVP
jgi:plastocyanin